MRLRLFTFVLALLLCASGEQSEKVRSFMRNLPGKINGSLTCISV